MATNLATMITRVRALLVDPHSRIWTEAVISEGLRLALAEYHLASGAAGGCTLQGLDGAESTSLPAEHESLVALGAAGYSAAARAVDQLDQLQVSAGSASGFAAWGDSRLREFRALLGLVFPSYRAAGAAGSDPAMLAAEIERLAAQAAALRGQEARASQAAQQSAEDRAAEAARRADLRAATSPPWATLAREEGIGYGEGYDRT